MPMKPHVTTVVRNWEYDVAPLADTGWEIVRWRHTDAAGAPVDAALMPAGKFVPDMMGTTAMTSQHRVSLPGMEKPRMMTACLTTDGALAKMSRGGGFDWADAVRLSSLPEGTGLAGHRLVFVGRDHFDVRLPDGSQAPIGLRITAHDHVMDERGVSSHTILSQPGVTLHRRGDDYLEFTLQLTPEQTREYHDMDGAHVDKRLEILRVATDIDLTYHEDVEPTAQTAPTPRM